MNWDAYLSGFDAVTLLAASVGAVGALVPLLVFRLALHFSADIIEMFREVIR